MSRRWQRPFLAALKNTGNVRAACGHAGVERSTVYRARRDDPSFAKKWDEAKDEATDVLEAEAWRRALRGVEEPVFYRGKQVGTTKHYSDALLMFLLRANRPETYAAERRPSKPEPQTRPAILELAERWRKEAAKDKRTNADESS